MKRKLLALALAGLVCLGLALPAAAVEEVAGLRLDAVAGYSPEDCIYTVVEDGLYGFYLTDGTPLLAPAYAAAGDFHDGMAAVSLTGEWTEVGEGDGAAEVFRGGRFGYVDTEGALVVPMRYRRAFPFSEGRAFAVDGDSGLLVLLDKQGEELASFPDAELLEGESVRFSGGRAVLPVREEEDGALSWLVVNTAGRTVCTLTDACADFANGYRDGRLAVAEEGEWTVDEHGLTRRFTAGPAAWGYRDGGGELAVDFQFDEAGPFLAGLAPVALRDGDGELAYGLADIDGELAVPALYEDARSCGEGLGAVLRDGRWAYVDRNGRRTTGFAYDEAGDFHEGVAMAREGGRLRALDGQGGVLFSVEGERALAFDGGVAVVYGADGSCGVCGGDGGLLVPFSYEEALHWDGYLWLKRGGLWRVYRTEDVLAAGPAAPEGEPAGIGAFTDVPADAWYADAVNWAADYDVVTGAGGGQFSPDRPCTVGEILTFLWRAAGRPEPSPEENPFTDVTPNHYYYQAALWAFESKMVPSGEFGAAGLCTRSMAVTYLWQLAGCPAGYEGTFSDVGEGAPCANAVAWAVAVGVTEGGGDGTFSPDEICSRGQIVTFLYRYLGERWKGRTGGGGKNCPAGTT